MNPSADVHGQLSAHLKPTLAFGIAALNGQSKADINVALDASATLDMNVNASITTGLDASGLNVVTQDVWAGCIGVETGLAVDAGANADFFGIFDEDTSVPLFGKTFDLFKACFEGGSGNEKRRAMRRQDTRTRDYWGNHIPVSQWGQASKLMKAVGGRVLVSDANEGGWACPASGQEVTSLVDKTVSGSR